MDMSGITKTIPQKEGVAAATGLYDGTWDEYEFHMAGKPSRLNVGDYIYTIWQDEVIGRCKVKEIILGAVNPSSGRPRSLLMVECPGEKLDTPFARKGHRGTRYYDGADWPA